MTGKTKTGLEILQASLLLGVLGDVLLRQVPWGLNAFLFVAAFAAALLMLLRRNRPDRLTGNVLALVGAMVFFASMFLVRDAIELRVYDTFAILIIMGVLMLGAFGVKEQIAGALHYAAGFLWSGLTSVFGSFILLGSDIEWKSMPRSRASGIIFSILRGLAIAMPLLLIFGALFMAADAVFEGYVNRALDFDIELFAGHIFLASMFAWLTAGYFRGALATPFAGASAPGVSVLNLGTSEAQQSSSEKSFVEKVAAEPVADSAALPDNKTVIEHINQSDAPDANASGGAAGNSDEPKDSAYEGKSGAAPAAAAYDWQTFDNTILPRVFTLGAIEIVIILGLLDLLFASFVIIQLPYLFGGFELVQATQDFKLAEYARRGFGELVAAAALALPVLMVSHWLLRKEKPVNEVIYRVLAGLQIALLLVVMGSAAQRLFLLTGNLGYGMTEVRFYPMVFMIWLAVVCGWFCMTVLRGTRQYFAWGALWSALLILAAANVFDPDDYIVRTNLRLMREGRPFDAAYNSGRSDDAIPVLLESIGEMSREDACRVKSDLNLRRIYAQGEDDLRSWNWSRSNAYSLLASNPAIRDVEGCENIVRW